MKTKKLSITSAPYLTGVVLGCNLDELLLSVYLFFDLKVCQPTRVQGKNGDEIYTRKVAVITALHSYIVFIYENLEN